MEHSGTGDVLHNWAITPLVVQYNYTKSKFNTMNQSVHVHVHVHCVYTTERAEYTIQ